MDVVLWVLGEWCKYNSYLQQLSFQAEECRRLGWIVVGEVIVASLPMISELL